MSAIAHFGRWRIKPSGKLPIFLRFINNSSFQKKYANPARINNILENRTYLNHMMYWIAIEYNAFENEIINHLTKDDGWFESYCQNELQKAESLYELGLRYKNRKLTNLSTRDIKSVLLDLLEEYRYVCCPWYAQYPLDEYFESAIEKALAKQISVDDPDFRKYVLIFTDPCDETEVTQERQSLINLAKIFLVKKEDLNNLSKESINQIGKHLDKYAYINRGLGTSQPSTKNDIIDRLQEIEKQTTDEARLEDMEYNASQRKVEDDFKWALNKVKPNDKFRKIIDQAKMHSYVRNSRVEAFIKADFGASFLYAEIANRIGFTEEQIMEITPEEMIDALDGGARPSKKEMALRSKNYAMLVRNSKTELITDPNEIEKLKNEYYVNVDKQKEIQGRVACVGGIIIGRAKICLDKNQIIKVEKGDILVAQFTTPDFVPAMEKAATIIADQGGLSSHAAIISRELGVPCVIDTKNGTRIIHDNDLLEVDTKKGMIKILESENA